MDCVGEYKKKHQGQEREQPSRTIDEKRTIFRQRRRLARLPKPTDETWMNEGNSLDKGLALEFGMLTWAIRPQKSHQAAKLKVKDIDTAKTCEKRKPANRLGGGNDGSRQKIEREPCEPRRPVVLCE